MMIARTALMAALLLLTAPAFADAPACADLPSQEQIDTCVFDELQASSAKLSETVSRLREEAKQADKEPVDGDTMADKLNKANLSFNTYIQTTCSYLADRHAADKTKAKAAYQNCNQKMIDQRLDLLTTETAQ